MIRPRHARTGDGRGFTLVELMVGVVVFGLVAMGIYQVMVHTSQSERVGSSMTEAQQNARAALGAILNDLRQAGYGIDANTVVPVETASEYRVTFVIDENADGAVDPGERITYFLDQDQSDGIVADTPNPYDYILRRVVSTAGDSVAAPAAGKGDIVAYGVTQRTPGNTSWNRRLFDYFDADGTSLIGSADDPNGSNYGKTVADSSLGKPAGGSNGVAVRAIRVEVVTEASHMDPETHDFKQVRVAGNIHPRNLGLNLGSALASAVGTGTGTGTGGGTGTGTATGTGTGTGTGTATTTTLPPQEPPIRIPTERVLSLALADFHEQDSEEGSNVTVDHVHDPDILVGTQAGGVNNLPVWFEGYPDRYPGDRLYNSVSNYAGYSMYDINGLAVGNIDGSADKYNDVVAAVSMSDVAGGFEVWLNQAESHEGWIGVGSTNTSANAFYSAGTGKAQSVALLDYDWDGDLDVALGTRTGYNTGTIEIWRNDGFGAFTYAVTYHTDGEVNAIAAGDFNRDNWADLAVGTKSGSKDYDGALEVWINNTAGSFTRRNVWESGGCIKSLAVGGMDAASGLDIVAGTYSGNRKGQVELWLNDGNGNFKLSDVADADDAVLAVDVGAIDYGNTSLDIAAGTAARSIQAWFCDPAAGSPNAIIPPTESWADANAGGIVNAVVIGKVEAPVDEQWRDLLNDIIVGTAIGSTSSGEIVIYLNPYVWTLTP